MMVGSLLSPFSKNAIDLAIIFLKHPQHSNIVVNQFKGMKTVSNIILKLKILTKKLHRRCLYFWYFREQQFLESSLLKDFLY